MPYSSYNSYILQTNGGTIGALFAVNYIAFVWNFRLLAYILTFRLIILAEFILFCICACNVWKASRNSVYPILSSINLPFQNIAFAPGPLLTTIRNVFRFLRAEFTSSNKPAPLTPSTQTPIAPLQNLKDDTQFVSLFSKGYVLPPQPSNIPAAKPFTVNPLAPTHSLKNIFNQPSSASMINEMDIAKAGLQSYGKIETVKPVVSFTNSGIPITKQQTLPKLRYTPCVQPPLQPTTHRERLLWFLSPTPEIVDDFRIEQMIDLQKNWNRYNDRTSRVYYDKMTAVLLKKIFVPLSKSIDFYNEMLTPRNRTVADCPAATVLLSMVMPTAQNVEFTLPEIEDFINVNGHTTVDGREYVLNRIKDLASSTRMQTYRFLPTVTGMPTDATIIMHVFQQYLYLKEPYAIPPLIPFEGDMFKFLLVYIKITPELDHWNVFDLSDQL